MKRLMSKKKKKQYIKITYSGTETRILLSNIQCVESNLRKVIFTLTGNKEIEISGKLADYEFFLTANGFCRCHKSYIVNIEHIDSIENDTFYLTGGKIIKISRTYLQSAKKAYFDYVFLRRWRNERHKRSYTAFYYSFHLHHRRVFNDELSASGKICICMLCRCCRFLLCCQCIYCRTFRKPLFS